MNLTSVSMASRPKVVLAAPGECVRLVDQQHPAERRVEDRPRLGGRLPDVAGDEVRAVGLDQVADRHDTEGSVDLGEQRATVVLPVPGLPVKTRWRLVSMVGRPRSARSCWTWSRLVRRRTSAFTWSSPISASSSARRSAIGRAGGRSGGGGEAAGASVAVAAVAVGGGAAGVVRRVWVRRCRRALTGSRHAGGVHRPQQHRPEPVDGSDLRRRGDEVDRCGDVGEAQGTLVVDVAAPGAVCRVRGDEELEERADGGQAVRSVLRTRESRNWAG